MRPSPTSPQPGAGCRRSRALSGFVLQALGMVGLALCLAGTSVRAAVVYEVYSAYHHIRVEDEGGIRLLRFDTTQETRMSLENPLRGHFEYTEFFHHAWLWNTNISRVLMLGLGGGSTQRSFLHHYPRVSVTSVELDPAVLAVATNYFQVLVHSRHHVQIEDGRSFLRRQRGTYDLIILDAYQKHRYGTQIPQHLATREFFELARERLSPQGVLAYNVITAGKLGGTAAGPAVARTLQSVFPQVYCFQARESLNVVLLATLEPRRLSPAELIQRANQLPALGIRPPPGVLDRIRTFRTEPPPETQKAPVLTDDFAPVESLDRKGQGQR